MIQTTGTREEAQALGSLLEELGREAHKRRFLVAPNPCVGAAILAGGEVLARGYHERWGGAHAEVEALRAWTDQHGSSGVEAQRLDTFVVTLEPCSSSGKTPPCTEALLAAHPARVVVGALDPDPRHRGRGLEILRQAGIEVVLHEGHAPLAKIAPHFQAWTHPERLRRPRPWTIAKWAQTRSGQLSPPAEIGGGRWISAAEALAEVQQQRARVDAIVTGVGTVLADDPRLSLRLAEHDRAGALAPLRVVLDSELRTPPTARLFAAPAAGELGGAVHIFCRAGASPARHRALAAAGATLHPVRPDERGEELERGGMPRPGMRGTHVTLSLREAWNELWALGARRLLVEAGPELISALLKQGFVDQLCMYTGAINGGRGRSLAGVFQTVRLFGRLDRECGPDAVLEAFVETPP